MVLGEGGVKMSKSLGNVINPDDIVKIYGAILCVFMKCSWDRLKKQLYGVLKV